MKESEFILTPKVGYRIIDTEKIKIDGLAGFRYRHFGESLSSAGLNSSASQNWVDPQQNQPFQLSFQGRWMHRTLKTRLAVASRSG